VSLAHDLVEAVQKALNDLNARFQEEVDAAQAKLGSDNEPLETFDVALKKSNVNVKLVSLVWAPRWKTADGESTPAW